MSDNSRSVIFVAPYCPAERGGAIALGGAAKQRAIMRGFIQSGWNLFLVNSGHQVAEWCKQRRSVLSLSNLRVIEIEPPRLPWRPFGKFIQCLLAPFIGFSLQRRLKPKLLWLYNPYLFEALYALGARLANPKVRLVLELEDLPTSRRRLGFGAIKTQLDSLSLVYLLLRVNGVTIVQENMRSLLPSKLANVWALPVLLPYSESARQVPDITHSVVGYFGGLGIEKGVDSLLEVIRLSSNDFRWLVCGAGDLAEQMQRLATSMPDKLRFLGAINETAFQQAYAEASVLVNLHKPLEKFSAGIFPYKLLEGVAAGKLIISTETTGCPKEVAGAIIWLKGDPISSCLGALKELPTIYESTRKARRLAQEWVLANYSAEPVIRQILSDLSLSA